MAYVAFSIIGIISAAFQRAYGTSSKLVLPLVYMTLTHLYLDMAAPIK